MEHETGRAILPGLAQVLGAVALVTFGTGYWYVAIPCVAVVVLCVLQLRRWTHRELEERTRLAEEPTEEEQEAELTWDADGGVSTDPRPDAPR
jgi:membrane protein implicated in regulation of membrane protease activity